MRRIELSLERALDGLAGRVFKGPLHIEELINRIERAADMASSEAEYGPTTANRYRVSVNPEDVTDELSALGGALSAALESSAMERGWRLDGPSFVILRTDPTVVSGTVRCSSERVTGPRPAWCMLVGERMIPVTVNRAVVGRAADADVVFSNDTVSRHHALLWTENGSAHIRDLGSSNGTRVDGELVSTSPIGPGAVLAFGEAIFRYETAT